MKTLEEAIKAELEEMEAQPEELDTLYLDNKAKAATVKGLEDFKNLNTLSLNNIGLTSLEGFPDLPELKKLFLADNKISGGLEHLAVVKQLEFIDLSNNKFSSIEQLKPLKDFPNLTYLEVEQNDFKEEDAITKLFEIMQQVEFINSTNRDGEEIEEVEDDDEEEDEGDEDANGFNDEDEEDDEEEDEEDENGDGIDQLIREDPLDDDEEEYNANVDDEDDEVVEEADDEEDEEEGEGQQNRYKRRKIENGEADNEDDDEDDDDEEDE